MFKDRATQIAPVEAIAVLMATWQCRCILYNVVVIWFIDNQAVCASLVRGASTIRDIFRLVAATHLLWAFLGARVWIEWVDSDSNISDGLSRDGCADRWTAAMDWHLGDTACLPWHLFQDLYLLRLPDALVRWADDTLGGFVTGPSSPMVGRS